MKNTTGKSPRKTDVGSLLSQTMHIPSKIKNSISAPTTADNKSLSIDEVTALYTQLSAGNLKTSIEAMRKHWEEEDWNLLASHAGWHASFRPKDARAHAYWAFALNRLGSYDGAVSVTARALRKCEEASVYYEYARLFLLSDNFTAARLCFNLRFPSAPESPWYDRERLWRLFLLNYPSKLPAVEGIDNLHGEPAS